MEASLQGLEEFQKMLFEKEPNYWTAYDNFFQENEWNEASLEWSIEGCFKEKNKHSKEEEERLFDLVESFISGYMRNKKRKNPNVFSQALLVARKMLSQRKDLKNIMYSQLFDGFLGIRKDPKEPEDNRTVEVLQEALHAIDKAFINDINERKEASIACMERFLAVHPTWHRFPEHFEKVFDGVIDIIQNRFKGLPEEKKFCIDFVESITAPHTALTEKQMVSNSRGNYTFLFLNHPETFNDRWEHIKKKFSKKTEWVGDILTQLLCQFIKEEVVFNTGHTKKRILISLDKIKETFRTDSEKKKCLTHCMIALLTKPLKNRWLTLSNLVEEAKKCNESDYGMVCVSLKDAFIFLVKSSKKNHRDFFNCLSTTVEVLKKELPEHLGDFLKAVIEQDAILNKNNKTENLCSGILPIIHENFPLMDEKRDVYFEFLKCAIKSGQASIHQFVEKAKNTIEACAMSASFTTHCYDALNGALLRFLFEKKDEDFSNSCNEIIESVVLYYDENKKYNFFKQAFQFDGNCIFSKDAFHKFALKFHTFALKNLGECDFFTYFKAFFESFFGLKCKCSKRELGENHCIVEYFSTAISSFLDKMNLTDTKKELNNRMESCKNGFFNAFVCVFPKITHYIDEENLEKMIKSIEKLPNECSKKIADITRNADMNTNLKKRIFKSLGLKWRAHLGKNLKQVFTSDRKESEFPNQYIEKIKELRKNGNIVVADLKITAQDLKNEQSTEFKLAQKAVALNFDDFNTQPVVVSFQGDLERIRTALREDCPQKQTPSWKQQLLHYGVVSQTDGTPGYHRLFSDRCVNFSSSDDES